MIQVELKRYVAFEGQARCCEEGLDLSYPKAVVLIDLHTVKNP
jgi:hypothetical protein